MVNHKLIKPVNKTASLVVNQSGCKDSIYVEYQHLKEYRAIASEIQQALKNDSLTKLERAALGARLNDINNVIRTIRRKFEQSVKISIHKCFVDIASESLPEHVFLEIMAKAKNMADKLGMKEKL